MGKLDIEIGMLMRKHKGDRLVIRLNGTSDISYETYKVIDGDKSDLRFLDGKNVVVGLKYKKLTGKGVNNASVMDMGFVVKVSEKNLVN